MRDTAIQGLPTVNVRRSRLTGAFYRRKVVPWLFVLPVLAINLLVVLGPTLAAVYYSMTDWSGIGAAEWVGLDNYRQLFFDDASFKNAFLHNLMWLAMFLTVPTAMGLIAASLLAPITRGALFFRMSLFIPYVLPSV
ncbi:MAG: sugar ABC transporter permease, partial [Chloroflexia bacterium]|nr:sugar ABC transporter permease [Chloroflexia bacterium]